MSLKIQSEARPGKYYRKLSRRSGQRTIYIGSEIEPLTAFRNFLGANAGGALNLA
jgi:hypothetical protein